MLEFYAVGLRYAFAHRLRQIQPLVVFMSLAKRLESIVFKFLLNSYDLSMSIKERLTQPSGHEGRIPRLIVCHPHYQNFNELVNIPALDDGDTVDYNVALIICGIIADNSWSTGWFARSSDGSDRCAVGMPLSVASGKVFYFVNDRNCESRQCYLWWLRAANIAICRQIPSLYFVGSLARP